MGIGFIKTLARRLCRVIRRELARGPYGVADYWRSQGVPIGPRTYIGRGVEFDRSNDPITIGADCVLTNCILIGHDASTNKQLGLSSSMAMPICIEDGCFIGHSAIILMGVTVGKGSIVGAGAICANDIPPGSVVAGNPARVIGTVEELVEKRSKMRERFPEHFPEKQGAGRTADDHGGARDA